MHHIKPLLITIAVVLAFTTLLHFSIRWFVAPERGREPYHLKEITSTDYVINTLVVRGETFKTIYTKSGKKYLVINSQVAVPLD